VLVKARNMDEAYKKGKLSYGKGLQDKIRENNIWYSLQLDLNQDSSFYLDTRNLRKWLAEHMQNKKVLNCFAYTGTLGIAALSGGAAHVIQTDINARFLDVAKKSAKLNAIPDSKTALVTSDFFKFVSRLKTSRTLFDCVILDPPFFSTNAFGAIDMEKEFLRVINKARPLIAHEGWMVVINNALYLSGAQMMKALEEVCDGTYLRIQETIPVPDDICGYPKSITTPAPVDPKPFNHPTKIVILKVQRKDKQAAS
jgi:23S rRNA (cytosine1962-C5)-methyltransferase